MTGNLDYSKTQPSHLVQLFAERAGCSAQTPTAAITGLIEEVRHGVPRKHRDPIQFFLEKRRIHSVEVVAELDADGFIEPLGESFAQGFRMVLKRNRSCQRIRFTMAHEICHTFFYELVPELKFGLCGRDDQEEWLCNLGAATLLIPNRLLKSRASGLAVCLESLCDLATRFSVSLSTMLLRLRSVGLWQCQLSLWHRKVNGSFLLERLYGGKQLAWQWFDESVLRTAWERKEPTFGHTFLSVLCSDGVRRYQPVSYQLRRYANGIMALWGKKIRPNENSARTPLFENAKDRLQQDAERHFPVL